MEEERKTEERQQAETDDSWQEAADQLRLAGRHMTEALRAAWNSDASRKGVRALEEALESLSRDMSQFAKEVASTPEAEQVLTSAGRVVETARVAGSQVLEEVRPRLVTALQQLNAELAALIERLEAREQAQQAAERIPVEGPAPETPVPPVQAVEAPPEAPPEEPAPERKIRVRGGRPIAEVDQDPWWSAWTRRR